MNARTEEVVVVGAGAVGLATALALARRGWKPLVLERAADVLSSCSAGSAGLLSPAHSTPVATFAALREGLRYLTRRDSPFAIQPRPSLLPWLAAFAVACRPQRVRASTELIRDLSFISLALHEELAAGGLDTGFERRGALNVYETEAGFEAGVAEAESLRAASIDSEIVESSGLAALEPALAPGLAGAVLFPGEAQCEPEKFVSAVSQAAVDAGAVLRTRAELLDIVPSASSDGVGLDTTVGRINADRVVLATGASIAPFGRRIGLRLPVQGAKGYHVDLTGAVDPYLPIYMQEARVIATSFGDRLRLAGTLELSGRDTGIDPVRVNGVVEAGRRTLRGVVSARTVEVWRGVRPCTPDGLPIIGASEKHPQVIVAAGHAMKGLHLAPVTGDLVAGLLDGKELDAKYRILAPRRFTVSLGSPSRRASRYAEALGSADE